MSETASEPVMVSCPHCQGTALTPLAPVYSETLSVLRAQSGEISGAALGRLVGCKNAAMANRLRALERLGLAAGRRDGRTVYWTPIPRKENEERTRKDQERSKRKETTMRGSNSQPGRSGSS
jgi:hypothetical protein